MNSKFEKFSESDCLNFLKENNIRTSGYGKSKVSGISYSRKLSSEIEWVEGSIKNYFDPESIKYYTILSILGNPWQKNWNLNADEIPFTLLLTELERFLELCISKFDYNPAYIEWTWDNFNFYLLKIKLLNEYPGRRLLISSDSFRLNESGINETNIVELNNKVQDILISIDKEISNNNEPLYIECENKYFINLDLFYSIFLYLGLSGKKLNSLNREFPVLQLSFLTYLYKTSIRKSFKVKIESLQKKEQDKFKINFLKVLKYLITHEKIIPEIDLKNKELKFSGSLITD